MEELKNKTFFVFGLSRSGKATLDFLYSKNITNIYAWDDNKELVKVCQNQHKNSTIKFISYNDLDWSKINILVTSPGVPLYAPKPHKTAELARKNKCKIICDVELLYLDNPNSKFIGITGTNGKSTTTALTGHILKEAGLDCVVGGNIGTAALALGKHKIYVLEMSSYQLDLIDKTKFNQAILLNITPDHIDRHVDMNGYIKAKKRIFMNQIANDYGIFSIDNVNTKKVYKEELKGRGIAIPTSTETVLKKGVSVINSKIYNNINDENEILELGTPPDLKGKHNAENISCAFAVAILNGINSKEIIKHLHTFKGLKHRMQLVRKINNINFINDSKATNDVSAEQVLKTFDNIYWIVGGRSKEGGIESLRPFFDKVSQTFLIGESTKEFAKTLDKDKKPYIKCETIKKALNKAYIMAKNESSNKEINIILSPACASFDQWKNFEVRGDAFMKMVKKLK
ncbi:UDP-N-acetylmuramoyl-L-alanine--D-glutamate ligase [Pseudomonadota bacterium]